jgi:sugar/nucleoside kinase (ribokinase family)
VLFANASEAAALFPRARASRLLDLCEVAVVKQGGAGAHVAWTADGDVQQIEVAASAIAISDTTGAGDAFAAGFLYSLVAASGRAEQRTAAVLRRATLAGHRSAGALLRSRREEIVL